MRHVYRLLVAVTVGLLCGQTVGDYLTTERSNTKQMFDQVTNTPAPKVALGCHVFYANGVYGAAFYTATLWEGSLDSYAKAGCTWVNVEVDMAQYVNNSSANQTARALYNTVFGPGGYMRTTYPSMKLRLNPIYDGNVPPGCTITVVSDWTACVSSTTYTFLSNETAYQFLAAQLQPEEFAVVHEPTTMAARWGQNNSTPADWGAFINSAATAVHAGNAGTTVACTAFVSELPSYTNDWATRAACAKVGLDIYFIGCNEQANGQCTAASSMGLYTSAFTAAHVTNGKPIYVEETSRPSYNPAGDNNVEVDAIIGCLGAVWERNRANMDYIYAIMTWAASQGVTDVSYNASHIFIVTTDAAADQGACSVAPIPADIEPFVGQVSATGLYVNNLVNHWPTKWVMGNFTAAGNFKF